MKLCDHSAAGRLSRGVAVAAAGLLVASLLVLGGCSGGSGGVEVADPSKTPDPQPGGVPEGYKPKEVVIE